MIENPIKETPRFLESPLGKAFLELEAQGIRANAGVGFTTSDGEWIMTQEGAYQGPYAFFNKQDLETYLKCNSGLLKFGGWENYKFQEDQSDDADDLNQKKIQALGLKIISVLRKYGIQAECEYLESYGTWIDIKLGYRYKDYCSLGELIWDSKPWGSDVYLPNRSTQLMLVLIRDYINNASNPQGKGIWESKDYEIKKRQTSLIDICKLIYSTSNIEFPEMILEIKNSVNWDNYNADFDRLKIQGEVSLLESIDFEFIWDRIHEYCDEKTIKLYISKVTGLDIKDIDFTKPDKPIYVENEHFERCEKYFNAGIKYNENKEYELAIEQLTKAIEIILYRKSIGENILVTTSSSELLLSEYYAALGFARECLGDYQGAILDLSKAIQLDPRNDIALTNRGNIKSILGELEEANKDYTSAIEINPEYINPIHNRGFNKNELGDYKGAISDYTRGLELEPGDLKLYENLAIARVNNNEISKAFEAYEKILEIEPKNADCLLKRGNLNCELGKHKEAILDYTKSIEVESEVYGTYINRARSRAALKDYKGAISDLRKAASLDSSKVRILQSEIMSYLLNDIELEKKDSLIINVDSKDESSEPSTWDAFYLSLEVNFLTLRGACPMNQLAQATITTLCFMIEAVDEDSFIGLCCSLEEESSEDEYSETEIAEFKKECTHLYKRFSEEKTGIAWIREVIESNIEDKEYPEQRWGIGTNKYCECDYVDLDSFLKDIDWDIIIRIVNIAWKDCLDKMKTEELRELLNQVENSSRI